MTGIVKWFSDKKGYGFITWEDIDVFVHYTAILAEGHRSLVKDEIIEFDLVKTENGLRAKNVVSVVNKED